MELTNEERTWRDDLQQRLKSFPMDADSEERIKAMNEIRDLSVRLHSSLREHGHEPRHHRYMIKNRGCDPNSPEFYFHLHSAEDLVKFTYDPHANDDPVDETIEHEFKINIYTRRWGHEDVYLLKRTASGWFVSHLTYSGPCDKACQPVLFEALQHDSVLYPHAVNEWFEWLWQQAQDNGLGHEDVQQGLNEIATWINATEKGTPVDGIWEGLA